MLPIGALYGADPRFVHRFELHLGSLTEVDSVLSVRATQEIEVC